MENTKTLSRKTGFLKGKGLGHWRLKLQAHVLKSIGESTSWSTWRADFPASFLKGMVTGKTQARAQPGIGDHSMYLTSKDYEDIRTQSWTENLSLCWDWGDGSMGKAGAM